MKASKALMLTSHDPMKVRLSSGKFDGSQRAVMFASHFVSVSERFVSCLAPVLSVLPAHTGSDTFPPETTNRERADLKTFPFELFLLPMFLLDRILLSCFLKLNTLKRISSLMETARSMQSVERQLPFSSFLSFSFLSFLLFLLSFFCLCLCSLLLILLFLLSDFLSLFFLTPFPFLFFRAFDFCFLFLFFPPFTGFFREKLPIFPFFFLTSFRSF